MPGRVDVVMEDIDQRVLENFPVLILIVLGYLFKGNAYRLLPIGLKCSERFCVVSSNLLSTHMFCSSVVPNRVKLLWGSNEGLQNLVSVGSMAKAELILAICFDFANSCTRLFANS